MNILCVAKAAPEYTGVTANEAKISFYAFIDLDLESLPTVEVATDEIHNQLKYMIGPMKYELSIGPFEFGRHHLLAAPSNEYTIEIKSMAYLTDKKIVRVHYSYTGKILVTKNKSQISLYLPINPKRFLEKMKGCYSDPLWYEWDGALGCRARRNKDYMIISGIPLEILPQTKISYPEYNRLINSQGEIKISILVGSNSDHNPKEEDAFKGAYYYYKKWLLNHGYEEHILTVEELNERLNGTTQWHPLLSEHTRTIGSYTFKVTLFYGNTGVYGNSEAFHLEYLKALKNSSVIIYDGHAGLGKNLDLTYFQKLENYSVNPNYQIFQFNTCLGYTYYGAQYIAAKAKGSVDFITKALALNSSGSNPTIINKIEDWANGTRENLSYQAIIKSYSSFFGSILADEDNPTEL